VSEALQTFTAAGVQSVWTTALSRHIFDPDGAITIARTLLETVCRGVVDENGLDTAEKEDLPRLYFMAAKALNMAPDQQSEDAVRSILGGAMAVVSGIGSLRNQLGDAPGRGASPRHAGLLVNMAGALATFLVETYLERQTELWTPCVRREGPVADPPEAERMAGTTKPTFDEAVALAEAGQIQQALAFFEADEDAKSALTLKNEDKVKFICGKGLPFTLLRRDVSIWHKGKSVLNWWEEHNGYYDGNDDGTGTDWRLDENPDNGPPPGVRELLEALEVRLPPVMVPRPPLVARPPLQEDDEA